MDIADALDQLGRQVGLDLRLDATRACRLVFDGRTTIDIEAPDERDGLVFLSCTVGLLPPADRRQATLETLLAANLFGRETGSAVLAIDADLGDIVLFRRLSLESLTHAAFVAALEDLVARAEAWTKRLATPAAPSTPQGVDDVGLYTLRL